MTRSPADALLLPSSIIVAALSASFSFHANAQNSSTSPPVEEVIVTAQKRDQRLQDVPISETVLSEDALRNAKIDSGTEIARQTPNLRVSVLGNESQPKFSMRGISTAEFNLNAISPTGVFYDEVYIGASYLGGAQIFDIERIEVLRGPQGTLFGKNTTAGAINFISKAPQFEREGYLTLGSGTYDYREIKGVAELPLIDDKLSARLAFSSASSDGYIENVNPQQPDVSDIDRQAGRLSLGYKDEAMDVTLRIFKNKSDPQAIGAINTGTGLGGTNGAGTNPRINPYTGQALDDDQVATDRGGKIRVRGDGGYLTINRDLGAVTLTSITSYLDGSFLNEVDADGTFQNVLHIDFIAENREISQDLRLSSNDGQAFNWIAGLYYFEDDVDVNTVYRIFEPFPGGVVLDQNYTQHRTSYAAYADGSYDLNEDYTIYAGLRYTDDEGRIEDFQVNPTIPPQNEVSYDDAEPTGRLGIQKRLQNHDVMLYAQYAYGYRSSAINGGALTSANELTVADPEKLNAYELGAKSQWLDRKVTLNGSLFYYDFSDQQFLNVAGIGQQQLVNAGESSVMGLELETIYRPTANLQISAGLGLLDSEYEDLNLNGEDLSGNELIEAPEHTFNIAVDYSRHLGELGSLRFHADATHIAEQHFSATNAPEYEIDDFWDLGARISFLSQSETFEVAFYGKNLTENDTPTGLQIDPSSMTRFTTVPYPRRFGIELTVWF